MVVTMIPMRTMMMMAMAVTWLKSIQMTISPLLGWMVGRDMTLMMVVAGGVWCGVYSRDQYTDSLDGA